MTLCLMLETIHEVEGKRLPSSKLPKGVME
jgi:hypothetical protein